MNCLKQVLLLTALVHGMCAAEVRPTTIRPGITAQPVLVDTSQPDKNMFIQQAEISKQQEPVFQVVAEAAGGKLNIDTLGDSATLQISYPTMAVGDTIGARLTGLQRRDTEIKTVTSVGVQKFSLPRGWLAENLNRDITLTYTYKVGGAGNLITSQPLKLSVVGVQREPVFRVLVEAGNGRLYLDTIGDTATLQVNYPEMAVGDTVGAKLTGVRVYNTAIKTVETVSVQTFSLPKAWLAENLDRSITLTFTHKVRGQGDLITSPPISFFVIKSTHAGQQLVDELNAQYENQDEMCAGNKAAFYCSGVLIRTVNDDPAFHAWNPSPSAMRLGGVSFSYMRLGLDMNRLQGNRTQGFILTTGNEFTHAGGYPLEVMCAFPYDAATVGREASGCGTHREFTDGGPCLSEGIDTLDKWRVHFNKYPVSASRYQHQCSFATDPASFRLSMLARENPDAESASWQQNEIVIKLWPQNTNTLPIRAFFYFLTDTRATGLAGAQSIQRDFFQQTHRIIPIVRVTPNITKGDVFSYRQEDQAL